MKKQILQIKEFLFKEIWRIRLIDLSPKKALQIKALRVVLISIRGIYEDKIQQRAAALTLYTLLSLVPILAIGFGVAKGFGYDQTLKSQLETYLTTKEELATDQETIDYSKAYQQIAGQLINFAESMLARTKGGLVAVVALVLLFWTVMKVLGNIENSFNDIWHIARARPFIRKLTDYLSIMFITPVLLIAITVAMVYLKNLKVHSLISPFLYIVVKTSPIFLIIVLFSLILIIMPNTRVKFKAGFLGGVITGLSFYITQQLYVHFQIGVSGYNAIYGGFAAIPLFIIWLQLSWLILLFGAKIAFAIQNIELYEFENVSEQMSDYSRRILALLITHKIVKNFKLAEKPLTSDELSNSLKIPIRMVMVILQDLVKCRILSEVYSDNPRVSAFQPAQHIEGLTVKYVMENIDKLGEEFINEEDSEITKKIIAIHNKFFAQIESMPENIPLKEL